ncbi:hypothetical protein Tco_0242506 [Tanacetum coccineum]
MSLDESDDLIILDAESVHPVLEANSLPKFDMNLYKSSLTDTHVKWLTKCYGISEDLRPRVVPEGMTMDFLPNDAIGLYVHHFQQGELRVPFSTFFLKVIEYFCVHISQLVPLGVNRATFFEMYCSSLDITPVVPLFRAFYKLCKQGNWFSFQNRVGKDCKPCLKDAPTSLKKWKDNFFLVDRRPAPIAMDWRHHDSSVADPFPKPHEFNASDAAKLREVVIALHKSPPSLLYAAGLSYVWKHACHAFSLKDLKGKVVTMAEFLRLPNFQGCKVAARPLLPPSTARVTHLSTPATRLEDILSKTSDMETTKILCRKVLNDKERRKKKVEAKAAARAPDTDVQAEKVTGKRGAEKEGPSRKKRKVRQGTLVHQDSEHVSSPIPLNHAKPLETLANEEYVSTNASADWMNTLWNQIDEHVTPQPTVHIEKPVVEEGGNQEDVNPTFANKGHRDNEDGFSGLRTEPSPIHHLDQHLDSVKRPVHDTIMPDVEASYSARRFGNLPFTPQWGLTDSCRIDNSRMCSDMMSNLFTPADYEYFNKGDRVEELEQEKAETYEKFAVECGNGEMVRKKIINEYLPTFVRWLHQSAEYKRSLGEAFSLAIGKGFDGISIGRKDSDIQAILQATPNVDPSSADTFIGPGLASSLPYVFSLFDHHGPMRRHANFCWDDRLAPKRWVVWCLPIASLE